MDKATLAITSGAAVIGATGINDSLSQVLGDIFVRVGLADFHPGAWAALIIIIIGSVMHTRQKKSEEAPAIPPVPGQGQ